MSAYTEKLKDPRWQRRRLEIMQLAGFECECCGGKENTLHVHHKIYRKGRAPWEYEDLELECLCKSCHSTTHHHRDRLNEALALLSLDGLEKMVGYAQGLAALDCPPRMFDALSYGEVEGLVSAARLRMTVEEFVRTMPPANDLDGFWLDKLQKSENGQ